MTIVIPPRKITSAGEVFAGSYAIYTQNFGEEVMARHSVRVRLSRSTVSALRVACLGVALVSAVGFAEVSRAADANSGNWIGSWTAPAQPVWTADFPMPLGLPSSLWKQTIRQNERLSIGGSRVRIVLSNEYGQMPLNIGAAHIALAADNGAIKSGSDHAVTFGGNPSIVIRPARPW